MMVYRPRNVFRGAAVIAAKKVNGLSLAHDVDRFACRLAAQRGRRHRKPVRWYIERFLMWYTLTCAQCGVELMG